MPYFLSDLYFQLQSRLINQDGNFMLSPEIPHSFSCPNVMHLFRVVQRWAVLHHLVEKVTSEGVKIFPHSYFHTLCRQQAPSVLQGTEWQLTHIGLSFTLVQKRHGVLQFRPSDYHMNTM